VGDNNITAAPACSCRCGAASGTHCSCVPQAILMYLGSKPDLVRQYSTAQLALVKVRSPA